MKALFILPTDKSGGAENVLRMFATELCNTGWHVEVVFLSGGRTDGWSGINLDERTYVPAKRERLGFLLSVFWFMRKRVVGCKYDVVISSHTHCNALSGFLRTFGVLFAKHTIYRESTNIFERFSGMRLKLFSFLYRWYGKPSLLICQTENMKRQLLKHFPISKGWNIQVIGNPVDSSQVYERALFHELNFKKSENEILHVGRLIHEKGVDLLVQAYAKLREDGFSGPLRIIGHGPMLCAIKELVCDLRLAEHVILHGFESNPFPYMANAKVAVVASRKEGFPNVLLEMMCISNRIVATTCADGVSKLPGIELCEPNSVDSLHSALRNVLNLSEQEVAIRVSRMRAATEKRSVTKYVEAAFTSAGVKG